MASSYRSYTHGMQPLWQQSPGAGASGGTGSGSAADGAAAGFSAAVIDAIIAPPSPVVIWLPVLPTPTQMSDTQFWRDARLPYAESRRAVHSRACYVAHTHDRSEEHTSELQSLMRNSYAVF